MSETLVFAGMVIFDLDGCATLDQHRRHLLPDNGLDGGVRHSVYDEYHGQLHRDSANPVFLKYLADARTQNLLPVFVTARPKKWAIQTKAWLRQVLGMNPVRDYLLYMRPDDDMRSSPELKTEIATRLLEMAAKNGTGIAAAFDDRNDVIQAYLALGIAAFVLDATGCQAPLLADAGQEPANAPQDPLDQFAADHSPISDEEAEELARAGQAPGSSCLRDGTLAKTVDEHIQAADGGLVEVVRHEDVPLSLDEAIALGGAPVLHIPISDEFDLVAEAKAWDGESEEVLEAAFQDITAADILQGQADLFRERNAVYKDNAVLVGQLMAVLFPNGVTLNGPQDFHYWHLFELAMVKLTRFVKGDLRHVDSMEDMTVYLAMLGALGHDHTITIN